MFSGHPLYILGSQPAPSLVAMSPPVLFFFLGVLAAMVRSNIAIPKAATKLLSLYLLWAIGFKGGVELVASGFQGDAAKTIVLALGISLLVPLWAYTALRTLITRANAAAMAACYGSVSVVTFLTACSQLENSGTPYSGHMVAVMALMESPAIVLALVMLHLDRSRRDGSTDAIPPRLGIGALLHESLLNGPVLLLLGSIVVGVLTGERGYAAFKPLCTDAFPGALAFFLLDLGLLAAKRFKDVVAAPRWLLVFALAAPLINAAIAIAGARALHIGQGDAVLLAVLAASASYIAAPAALRLAVPSATPGLYVSLSLGVTFPFNIIVGLPLYAAVVARLW
ncbi:MAG: sodium-dependent bicarbonate transport family permease [Planctomycetota bacterium]|nr:sodium-dependent bicarbonate transport family permease [Planctomycetota bacterium]